MQTLQVIQVMGGFFPLARERALKGEGYLQIQASLAFLPHVLLPDFSLTLNEQP